MGRLYSPRLEDTLVMALELPEALKCVEFVF